MQKRRIAFLTPEFTTEYANGGGLGNYLNRISKALRDQGHQPEIFVVSKETPGTFDFEGVLVHRVGYADARFSDSSREARGLSGTFPCLESPG